MWLCFAFVNIYLCGVSSHMGLGWFIQHTYLLCAPHAFTAAYEHIPYSVCGTFVGGTFCFLLVLPVVGCHALLHGFGRRTTRADRISVY